MVVVMFGVVVVIMVIGVQQVMLLLCIEEVKDGLFMVIGFGGNVGVCVISEGVILIDNKFLQNFVDI